MSMKRLIYAMMVLGVLFATSCKKDEIGATATVDMAGEWYVCAEYIDGDTPIDEYGPFIITTFNTAANVPTEMFVYDCLNFWEFQVPVTVDPVAKTFATNGPEANLSYDGCFVRITDGKVVEKGAVTPSGVPADAIEFKVTFSDDTDGYVYRFYGYRYTGLVADE